MGRTIDKTLPLRQWELRLTPDYGDINFEHKNLEDAHKVFVACKEGGEGTGKRLHYHVYMETQRSETFLRHQAEHLAGGKGNAFYSLKKAHEGTVGYVVKEGDVVFRHGWDNLFLDEMLSKSQQYRKDLEADRKRQSRKSENTLSDIMKVVAETITSSSTPRYVVNAVLKEYNTRQLRFPTRNALESAVLSALYPHNPVFVQAVYASNLERIYFAE